LRLERNDGNPRITRLGLAAGGDTWNVPGVKQEKWWFSQQRAPLSMEAVSKLLSGKLEFQGLARTLSVGIPTRAKVDLASWVETKIGLHSEGALFAEWKREGEVLQLELCRRFICEGPSADPFLGGAKESTLLQAQGGTKTEDFGEGLEPLGWQLHTEWNKEDAAGALTAGWNHSSGLQSVGSRATTALFSVGDVQLAKSDLKLCWRAQVLALKEAERGPKKDQSHDSGTDYNVFAFQVEGAGLFARI
jgi:hypothetical protein